MNPVPENIIKKLQKLIDHERSARTIGSLHEAQAFAGKIQDLLQQYKLSMDEVAYATRVAEEPVGEVYVYAKNITRKRIQWQQLIAQSVALVNGCIVMTVRGSNTVVFIGRKVDMELCRIMYLYMLDLGEEMCLASAVTERGAQFFKFHENASRRYNLDYKTPQWKHNAFKTWMNDYKKSWLTGFSDAIAARLVEKHDAGLREAARQNNSLGLVHIKKDKEAVDKYYEDRKKIHKPKMLKHPKRQGRSRDGYDAGKDAGSNIALTPNSFAPKSSGKVMGLLQ